MKIPLTVAAGIARDRAKNLPQYDQDLRVDGSLVMCGGECLVQAASPEEAERAVHMLRELHDDGRVTAYYELGEHFDALRNKT